MNSLNPISAVPVSRSWRLGSARGAGSVYRAREVLAALEGSSLASPSGCRAPIADSGRTRRHGSR